MDSLKTVEKECHLERAEKAVVMRMTKTLPQNSKKCDFVNVSVEINSSFPGCGHNVRHLICVSCYVPNTSCLNDERIYEMDHI